MLNIKRHQVSPQAISIALLIFSAVWFAGAGAWFVQSDSKDGWSATPLLWMLILMITPVPCLIGVIALIRARQGTRLTGLDRSALVAAFPVVILGALLLVAVLAAMLFEI